MSRPVTQIIKIIPTNGLSDGGKNIQDQPWAKDGDCQVRLFGTRLALKIERPELNTGGDIGL